jgi:SRSO17 transposase
MQPARMWSKWRGLGENVRNLQYHVGQRSWKTEPVLAAQQRLVAETLGEADGVALIDESGVVKQGDCSVYVAAEYCGAVGKIANSQNGVYLGYVSRKGYSLIEGQLFMPESWFDEHHAEQRQACGVPADLEVKTKPEIGLELLKRAIQRGSLPFQWIAADELYAGPSKSFLRRIRARLVWISTKRVIGWVGITICSLWPLLTISWFACASVSMTNRLL